VIPRGMEMGIIADKLFVMADDMEKKRLAFEKRCEERDKNIEKRCEERDKNIERLLKILAEQKK
jgi:hypothetical protein